MKKRDTKNIDLLKRIYRWYNDIYIISLVYSQEESEESLQEMLNKREELLNFIAVAQQKLDNKEEKTTPDLEKSEILKEINSVVEKIAIVDKELKGRLKERMEHISSEISTLYERSKAVSAYSKQL